MVKKQQRTTSARPKGALAIVGAWREVGDEIIESLTKDIYSARETDLGRQVELDTLPCKIRGRRAHGRAPLQ